MFWLMAVLDVAIYIDISFDFKLVFLFHMDSKAVWLFRVVSNHRSWLQHTCTNIFPDPSIVYCWLNRLERTSVKFESCYSNHHCIRNVSKMVTRSTSECVIRRPWLCGAQPVSICLNVLAAQISIHTFRYLWLNVDGLVEHCSTNYQVNSPWS